MVLASQTWKLCSGLVVVILLVIGLDSEENTGSNWAWLLTGDWDPNEQIWGCFWSARWQLENWDAFEDAFLNYDDHEPHMNGQESLLP